jgi:hypothetical protein
MINLVWFVTLFGSIAVAPISLANAATPTSLDRFYIHHIDPMFMSRSFPDYKNEFIPEIKVTGSGFEPGSRVDSITGKRYNSVHRLVGLAVRNNSTPWDDMQEIRILAAWSDQIMGYATEPLKRPVLPDTDAFPPLSQTETWWPSTYDPLTVYIGAYEGFPTPPPSNLVTTSKYTIRAAARRRAIDGGEYDASAMEVSRGGVPWYTHFWGYRLGLVANESRFDNANRDKFVANWPVFPSSANNFELATLPPPWIEDDIIEYVNRADFPAQPGGQYFYAVRAEDKTLLDSIPVWQRTGKSFKSGGYVSACRFYGGKNGGPNTHFYSADDKECAALKAIPQLSYEGQTFAVNVPLPGAAVDGVKPCPVASKPLYRVYNNASKSSGRFVSNHRYLTEKADVAAVVAQGWADEGQVMCVPQ